MLLAVACNARIDPTSVVDEFYMPSFDFLVVTARVIGKFHRLGRAEPYSCRRSDEDLQRQRRWLFISIPNSSLRTMRHYFPQFRDSFPSPSPRHERVFQHCLGYLTPTRQFRKRRMCQDVPKYYQIDLICNLINQSVPFTLSDGQNVGWGTPCLCVQPLTGRIVRLELPWLSLLSTTDQIRLPSMGPY